jgi:hypothetical protein
MDEARDKFKAVTIPLDSQETFLRLVAAEHHTRGFNGAASGGARK